MSHCFSGGELVVANEAGEVAASVGPWVDQQSAHQGTLEQWLERIPGIDRLAPYQDAILATGTRGTSRFFVLLFIMLYAMFFFLREGRPSTRYRLLQGRVCRKRRNLDWQTNKIAEEFAAG